MQKIIAACLWMLAGFSQAAFQARDMTGDGVADAYYDTDQNITWLADANYYATQGNPPMVDPFWRNNMWLPPTYLPAGQVQLYALNTSIPYAANWVAGLSVGGVQGWRLPHRLVPAGTNAGGPRFQCDATGCNEQWNWPSELTWLAMALNGQSGPFINVMGGSYLAVTPNRHQQEYVQLSNPLIPPVNGMSGMVSDETSYIAGYVWAVHDGDVGSAVSPVPVPAAAWLLACGLPMLLVRRKRSRVAL